MPRELRLHNHLLCPSRPTSNQLTRVNGSHVLRSVVATTSITDGDDPDVRIVPTRRRHIVERGRKRTRYPPRYRRLRPRPTPRIRPRGGPRPSLSRISLPSLFPDVLRKRRALRNFQAAELFGADPRRRIRLRFCLALRLVPGRSDFLETCGTRVALSHGKSRTRECVAPLPRRLDWSSSQRPQRNGAEPKGRASSKPLLLRSALLPVTTAAAPFAVRNHCLASPSRAPLARSVSVRRFNRRERRSASHPLFIESGAGALPNSI